MDNYSFGSLTTDEAHIFTEVIMGALRPFGLVGVELNDENAGLPPFYPDELKDALILGDIDENGSPNEAADAEAAWYYGGDMMCNLTYFLRLELDKTEAGSIEEHEKIIIVRETNFGRYFPYDVSGSADDPTFVTSAQETDYFVNPYFYSFIPDSAQRDPGNSSYPLFESYRNQYAPMIVDLGGLNPSDPTEKVVPTVNASNPANTGDELNPGSLFDFHAWFKNGGYPGYAYTSDACDYGLLYYHNLKAVSEAETGDYLYSPVYSRKLTQAEYMTATALTLFKDRVVLAPGALGDYKKTW
jgi:hypothetical protein